MRIEASRWAGICFLAFIRRRFGDRWTTGGQISAYSMKMANRASGQSLLWCFLPAAEMSPGRRVHPARWSSPPPMLHARRRSPTPTVDVGASARVRHVGKEERLAGAKPGWGGDSRKVCGSEAWHAGAGIGGLGGTQQQCVCRHPAQAHGRHGTIACADGVRVDDESLGDKVTPGIKLRPIDRCGMSLLPFASPCLRPACPRAPGPVGAPGLGLSSD